MISFKTSYVLRIDRNTNAINRNAIRDNLIIDTGAFAEKSTVCIEGQSEDEPWRNSR